MEITGYGTLALQKPGPQLAGMVLCLVHTDLLEQSRKCLLI